MIKRLLGNTGIEVSEIAFGGVEIEMPYGIGVSSEKDMLSESKAIELLHTALDNGINFFDTARMYGQCEKIIGKAFKDKRDKVVLATKCRHLLDSDGNLPNDSMLKTMMTDSLYESLKTLQTDCVDIFMLHHANQRILENEAIVCVLSELKERGLFREMGVSTYTTDETKMALDSAYWNMIQLSFNLMDQRQGDLFEDAHHKGVGLVAVSTFKRSSR
jgi:aryl-alcohol dehydrogenase-like predicted oxidoreductase